MTVNSVTYEKHVTGYKNARNYMMRTLMRAKYKTLKYVFKFTGINNREKAALSRFFCIEVR